MASKKIIGLLLVLTIIASSLITYTAIELGEDSVAQAKTPDVLGVAVSPEGTSFQLGVNTSKTFTASALNGTAPYSCIWNLAPTGSFDLEINGEVTALSNATNITVESQSLTLKFPYAVENEFVQAYVQVTDSEGLVGKSDSILIADPYTSPGYKFDGSMATAAVICRPDGLGWFRAYDGKTGAKITALDSTSADTTLDGALIAYAGKTVYVDGGAWTGANLAVPASTTLIADPSTTGIKYTSIGTGSRIDEPAFNTCFGGYSGGSYTIVTGSSAMASGTANYLALKPDSTISWSSTNASYTINSAIQAMPINTKITVNGDIKIDIKVVIDKKIMYEHNGVAYLTGTDPYIEINTDLTAESRMQIYIGGINGTKTQDGVKIVAMNGAAGSVISWGIIRNVRYGVLLSSEGGSTARYSDIMLKGGIQETSVGIYAEGPSGSGEPFREGIIFDGRMFGNDDGVYFASGTTKLGGFVLFGTIDNADNAGSYDFRDFGQQALQHVFSGCFIRANRVVSYSLPRYFLSNVPPSAMIPASQPYNFVSGLWTQENSATGNAASYDYNVERVRLTTATTADGDGAQLRCVSVQDARSWVFSYRLQILDTTNSTVRVGMSNYGGFVDSDDVNGVQMYYNGTGWTAIVGNGTASQTLPTSLTGTVIGSISFMVLVTDSTITDILIYNGANAIAHFDSGVIPTTSQLPPFFSVKASGSAGTYRLLLHQGAILTYL